jgi:hypothetical protein
MPTDKHIAKVTQAIKNCKVQPLGPVGYILASGIKLNTSKKKRAEATAATNKVVALAYAGDKKAQTVVQHMVHGLSTYLGRVIDITWD